MTAFGLLSFEGQYSKYNISPVHRSAKTLKPLTDGLNTVKLISLLKSSCLLGNLGSWQLINMLLSHLNTLPNTDAKTAQPHSSPLQDNNPQHTTRKSLRNTTTSLTNAGPILQKSSSTGSMLQPAKVTKGSNIRLLYGG